MAGQVAAALFNLPSQLGLIKSGKLRALAVSSRTRAVQLPDVPTIEEAGVAGFEVVVWYAIFVPAGTPKAVHARLRDALRDVLHSRQTRDQLAVQGVDATPSTPEELARHSRAEVEKWSSVARQAGIKVD
jgi:tripartite-type tricarboxylate transporter receptor subunit TctC